MSFLRKMKRELNRAEKDVRKFVVGSSDDSDDENSSTPSSSDVISQTHEDLSAPPSLDNVMILKNEDSSVPSSSDNVKSQTHEDSSVPSSSDNVKSQTHEDLSAPPSLDNVISQTHEDLSAPPSSDNVISQTHEDSLAPPSSDNVVSQTHEDSSTPFSSDNIKTQTNLDSSAPFSSDNIIIGLTSYHDNMRKLLYMLDKLGHLSEKHFMDKEHNLTIIKDTDEVFPPETTVDSFYAFLKKEWENHIRTKEINKNHIRTNKEILDYTVEANSLTAIHEKYESVLAEINAEPWRIDVERDFPPTQHFEEIKDEMKLLDKYEVPLDHDFEEDKIFEQLAKEKANKFRTEVDQRKEIRRRKTRPLEGPYQDFYDYRSEKNGHALLLYHPDLKSKIKIFCDLLETNLTFQTTQMYITNRNQIKTNLQTFFKACESESDGDCLMIVILTYGYVDDTGSEIINCGDNTWINSSDLWWLIDKYQSTNFTNKPKIVIQVGWPCEMMKSKGLQSDDAGTKKPEILIPIYNPKNLPSMSHLCIVSAIPQGSCTVANDKDKELASCFVKTLVNEFRDFRSEQHLEMDWELMSILTEVNKQLYASKLKRCISVLSSLTGAFEFKKKEP